jgi:hypothetical protein
MADVVQNPASLPGTAIIIRGAEGSGKGTFVAPFEKILGSYYSHIIDTSHLMSQFNSHLADTIVCYVDEAYWGGYKSMEGKLKGLVTEPVITIERKGIDAVTYRNHMRVIVASNEEWVIPAGSGSRRWFVVDCMDVRVGDFDYFEAIRDELDDGGVEALMHFLLNRKITNNIRKAPETKFLKEQRALSVSRDSFIEWWMNQLESEMLDAPDLSTDFDPQNPDMDGWPTKVQCAILYESYKTWALAGRIEFVSKMVFYRKCELFGMNKVRAYLPNRKRGHAFTIPPVTIAKKIFAKIAGFSIEEAVKDEVYSGNNEEGQDAESDRPF